jgi:hypothetical protein
MRLNTDIEKSEEGLEEIIRAALLFEENHYLEAVRLKRLDEYDILQLTEDVRLWHSRMRKESLKLSLFSETFLDEYATNNNLRFRDAYQLFSKVRSTISGSRKMFKKFCMRVMKNPSNPNASNSVLDRSLLTAHAVSRDIFGLAGYDEKVRTLYEEMKMFFTTLVVTLSLCHRMIRDEEEIMKNAPRCLEIYRKCREGLLSSARLFARTFNVQVKTVTENELIARRQKATSLQDYAQRNYHKLTKEEYLTVVAYEVVSEGAHQGMTEMESLLWPNNPEKAFKVREVIAHFDQLLPEGKKKFGGKLLLEFIKWGGVSKDYEHKLYNHLITNYECDKEFVGWTQVFNTQKELCGSFSDEQLAQAFEDELAKLEKQAA